jgi:hypothetical protein
MGVWHKSRRCESGTCVEGARFGDAYGLRDSQEPNVILRFDAEVWAAFTNAVRTGAFDLPPISNA